MGNKLPPKSFDELDSVFQDMFNNDRVSMRRKRDKIE